jgi:hypothetical protein
VSEVAGANPITSAGMAASRDILKSRNMMVLLSGALVTRRLRMFEVRSD